MLKLSYLSVSHGTRIYLNISLVFTTCELVGEPGYAEQNGADGVHERLGHRGLEVHAAVRHPPTQGQPGRRLLQVTLYSL
jgi:hypothetical protein